MSLFGSIFHGLFGGGGPKKDPYANLMNQLNPLINTNTDIAKTAGTSGLANIDTATKDYDYVSKYLKSLFEGSDSQLLSLLDSSGATQGIDENAQQISELGVRGGNRSANLGQANFNRDAQLSNLLKQLRFAAPDKLAQIAQGIGNLGTGELSASTGASNIASNNLFGVEQLHQADADRKAALIGSIFQSIGATAGALACLVLEAKIKVPGGAIRLANIQIGDEIISRTLDNNRIIRKVIRIRDTPNQLVKDFESTRPSATPSHVFYTYKWREILCSELESTGEHMADVRIIKLDNEQFNYPFLANEYWSCDDDCLLITK